MKIETKYFDNSFIFLGHTGYGKSTACRALTGNKGIKITSSHDSCTTEVNYYPGKISNIITNTYFTVIDTPGLDDSNGRDKAFVDQLRNMLQKKDLKIKGIFIAFNFQTKKFGESEKKILRKIIDLVPIKEVWKYISIIVTHCYYDKPQKLNEKKKQFKKDFKDLFENELLRHSFKKYGVVGKFTDINLAFVNFDDTDPTFEEAKDITNIIQKNISKEPLFQKIVEEIKNDVAVIEYDKIDSNKATLYKCTIKIEKYLGQEGKILNEIRIITGKKKEKEIEKCELDTSTPFISGAITGGISLLCLAGLAFPPLEIAAALGALGAGCASWISDIVGFSKWGYEAYKNSDFKNDELGDFCDESK